MSYSRLMYHMRNAPVYMLWLVGGLCVVAAIISLFIWFVIGAVIILGAAFVWWATGVRISVKQDDVIIGHVRWFTYTPVLRSDKEQ